MSFNRTHGPFFLVSCSLSYLLAIREAAVFSIGKATMPSNEFQNGTSGEPPFNVEFELIPETTTESFRRLFTAYSRGLYRSVPGNVVLPPLMAAEAEKYFRVKPRTDDVWLLSYPKSGNTSIITLVIDSTQHVGEMVLLFSCITGTIWTSELLWLLTNDFDFETATRWPTTLRIPELEYTNPISYKASLGLLHRLLRWVE